MNIFICFKDFNLFCIYWDEKSRNEKLILELYFDYTDDEKNSYFN